MQVVVLNKSDQENPFLNRGYAKKMMCDFQQNVFKWCVVFWQ